MPEEAPLVLGRYELGPRIGEGGMGEVFRGLDRETGQSVAIKRLKSGRLSTDPTLVERFEREGDALRALDHPNIVKVLASAEEAGRHYIIMELVAGGSLADLLSKEGRLSMARTIGIALGLADALTRSHHLKIVHRDIKPGNVLLAEDGTPRLTDFGVARIGASTFTGTGNVIGTYGYISPEALQGHGSDTRGDIWAFGVLLYEIVAGRRPFAANEPATEMMAILKERPPALDELLPEVPVALVDLVGRMLEKEPQQRIPSMRRVGAELESIQVGAESRRSLSEEPTFERSRFAEAPSSSPSRHNLPLQPTPFIGREQELAEVISLLEPPDTRLVTLVGPGGMGKTRLAIEAARALLDAFSGGVFFVPLAPLADPSQIISGVADAVGYSFSGPEDPKRQLLNFLREKSLLLVLDTFEHLTEGTGLLADIATEAPGVKLLATSRERLKLRFERIYECGGMQIPSSDDSEAASSSGAVRLFETSARRARPDFELSDDDVRAVVEICRLVMGMPLGIELAAAWIAMLSPEEILEEVKKSLDFLESEMRDVPERHRSVRAVFDSSWNLLKPDERDALARLTVFRGGFDRNAANEVSGAGLRTLARLVSQSLLKRSPAGRYDQHGLVQQFAREHLESSGQAEAVRKRHADYFCDYTERLEQRLRGRTQARALAELEQELDNMRATWEFAIELDANGLLALTRLVESLFRFFEMKGRFKEGQKLFGETAARIRSEGDTAQVLRARLLARQGRFGHRLGGCQQAREIFENSLAMAREHGLKGEVAFCLQNLADVTSLLGEYQTSTEFAKEALTVCEELGDRWTMESVLNNLGVVSYQQEKLDDAAKYYRESLEIARELGDLWGSAFALNNLGVLAHDGSRFDEAKKRYLESLRVCEDMGDTHGVAAAHINLGRTHYELGELPEAKASATKGLELSKDLGDSWGTIASLINLGELELAGGDTSAARLRFIEGLERARPIRATPLILEALVGLAQIASVEGRVATAIELLAHVAAHSGTDPETRDRATQLMKSLAELPGDATITEAKNRGELRQLDELVNEVIAES